jgi:PPOX class probable F420-dependent enzyme
MSVTIPEAALALLNRPLICVVITVMPDGQPQATPVWFDFDGTNIRFNTAEGRQKARNAVKNSKVTVSIVDPQNPSHWLEWRGHVAEVLDEAHGSRDHMNALAKRYTGKDVYESANPDEKRLQIVIAADKINAQ